MNCSFKLMIKLAGGLGVALALAYFALPGAKAFVIASAPILLALVCPLTIVVAMIAMRGNSAKADAPAKVGPAPQGAAGDAVAGSQ